MGNWIRCIMGKIRLLWHELKRNFWWSKVGYHFKRSWFKMSPAPLTKSREANEDLLREIVNRIVQSFNPQKIILFGSYAYGKPHEGSDLDILVIMESTLPRYKRSIPIYRSLADLLVPMDILVYTPEEVEAWKDVSQAFITSILKKRKVLYEKK